MANNKKQANKVEAEEAVVTQVEVTETKKEKRKLQRNDLIPVMNYTSGLLVYEARDGRGWRFENYGDTDEMELGDLITMKNSQPRLLNEPWLLILDEDAVEYLGLSKLYERVVKPDDVENLFKLPENKLEEVLTKAPLSVKQLVADMARQMVDNQQLTNIVTIKVIERILNINLID